MPSYALAGGSLASSYLPTSATTTQHQPSKLLYEGVQVPASSSGSVCGKDLVTVNKINLVASSVLAKDSSRKVDFDFGTHITFPVLKFV